LGDLLEQLQIHLGVKGGRLDRSMAQDGRDIFEPDILTQHLAGLVKVRKKGPIFRL
jgi:hypothetical protein